jgi:hypothetical protein
VDATRLYGVPVDRAKLERGLSPHGFTAKMSQGGRLSAEAITASSRRWRLSETLGVVFDDLFAAVITGGEQAP